ELTTFDSKHKIMQYLLFRDDNFLSKRHPVFFVFVPGVRQEDDSQKRHLTCHNHSMSGSQGPGLRPPDLAHRKQQPSKRIWPAYPMDSGDRTQPSEQGRMSFPVAKSDTPGFFSLGTKDRVYLVIGK
ncbi:hypothetical protein STEG23_011694, partial [Scotinomys teguina]